MKGRAHVWRRRVDTPRFSYIAATCRDIVAGQPLEALRDKLRTAMKIVLEYQQNPLFHSADTRIRQAEAAAVEVYTNERVSKQGVVALGVFDAQAPLLQSLSWRPTCLSFCATWEQSLGGTGGKVALKPN